MADGISVLADFNSALYENAEPPLVSLYFPTHGPTGANDDRIQFDDLVAEAKTKLAAKWEHREHVGIDETLDYLGDHWEEAVSGRPAGGIGMLVGNDRAYLYTLGYPIDSRVVVGDSFYVKPLLRTFEFGSHYFLLGLNADRFSFIHGDFGSLRRMDMPSGVEDEFSELFPKVYDGRESALDYESLENHQPPYHGWKSRNDVKQEEAGKFFRFVNKAVTKHLANNTELPIILVSLPEHQTPFRRISTIPHLLDEGIEKNVDGMESPELLADAVAVIERARKARTDLLLQEFAAALPHGKAADDLASIGLALAERKVRVLFVEDGLDIPGTFDSATGDTSLCDREERGGHGDLEGADLIDAFARAALQQDAEVLAIDRDRMPADVGVAALFRY